MPTQPSESTIAIYARISTDNQDWTNQQRDLNALIEREYPNSEPAVFVDVISGSKSATAGPQLQTLLSLIAKRKITRLYCYDISRLARNTRDLLNLVHRLDEAECSLRLYQHDIDTKTAAGRLFIQMAAVFAEFERSQISERIRSALRNRRARGQKLGRPPTPPETIRQILKLHKAGHSYAAIAIRANVSKGTVHNLLVARSKRQTADPAAS